MCRSLKIGALSSKKSVRISEKGKTKTNGNDTRAGLLTDTRTKSRLKKKYLKTRPMCKVTFSLPPEAVGGGAAVALVGEFNNWDSTSHKMKRLKNGDFSYTMELSTGRDYRFRYCIDGVRWENDWGADRYESNPYGCEDSVISV